MTTVRWIMHVDMDAFYASIEQRDNPALRGMPVIVGGLTGRGVVATASYEARQFGVHSAMSMKLARRLCPNGVFLPVRMSHYRRISHQIRLILSHYSPFVEPLALDEAFLDVSGMGLKYPNIVDIAKVQFGVEDFEAVAGLPESVFVTEGFACLNDILFSGILFCLLPTLYLVPKLYGKIEPLLGMQPRTEKTALEPIGGKVVIGALIAFAVALASELLATAGFSVIDWEAEWAESSTALAVGIVAAAVLAVVIVLVMRKNGEKTAKKGV